MNIGGSQGPVDVTGLGGWSLGIHHSYDPIAGILYKGSGEQIAYKDKFKVRVFCSVLYLSTTQLTA